VITLSPVPRPEITANNRLVPPWQSWFSQLARVVGFLNAGSYTVATLPSAATAGIAARAYVTDANATTFASIAAGGGTNKLWVTSDGTNWRIG
jgi:hypothetical protein